jgi:hypothetical protein
MVRSVDQISDLHHALKGTVPRAMISHTGALTASRKREKRAATLAFYNPGPRTLQRGIDIFIARLGQVAIR